MKIQVFFDTICPWCYIGKRKIEQAIALRPHVDVHLSWRPFILNQEIPPGGMDQTTYLIRKFGSETRVRRVYGAIAQAGESVNINFAFDQINRTPNSVDSHRFIRFAKQNGAHETVVETLFFEYFINGKDIGRKDVLCDIGTQIGLQSNIIEAYLNSDKDINFVHDENIRAHRMGVNGVPAFIFNEKMIISGAQEPQVLARMIDAAFTTDLSP